MIIFRIAALDDYLMFFYLLLILTTTTDLLEGLIKFGEFYLSPVRIYIVFISFFLFLGPIRDNRLTLEPGGVFKKYFMITLALVIVIALSISKSPDTLYSTKRAFNIFSLILVSYISYFLAKLHKINMSNVLNLWLSIGLVMCVLGLLQWLLGVNYGSTELQYSERKLFFIEIKRISSLFNDPNFFSYYLITIFFLSVHYPYAKKNYFKPFLILVSLMFIVFTGSRGALIATLGAYVLSKTIISANVKTAVLASVLAVLATILSLGIASPHMREAITYKIVSLDTEEQSILSRILIWQSGLQLVLNDPLLGVGPGNFVRSGKGQYLEGYRAGQQEVISNIAGHSNYLEIAAESGVGAMMLYVSIFIYILVSMRRALKVSEGVIRSSLKWTSSSLMGMMIANLFLSYYSFFLFLLIGVSMYLSEKGKNNEMQIA